MICLSQCVPDKTPPSLKWQLLFARNPVNWRSFATLGKSSVPVLWNIHEAGGPFCQTQQSWVGVTCARQWQELVHPSSVRTLVDLKVNPAHSHRSLAETSKSLWVAAGLTDVCKTHQKSRGLMNGWVFIRLGYAYYEHYPWEIIMWSSIRVWHSDPGILREGKKWVEITPS